MACNSYSIKYITNVEDANEACSEIRNYPGPLGFDMEWNCFKRMTADRIDVIQICPDPTVVYIFHLTAIPEFPVALKNLLMDRSRILTGMNIRNDLLRLKRSQGFHVIVDVVDLSELAESKGYRKVNGTWGLDELAHILLGNEMDKSCTTSNWAVVPLSQKQKLYAAKDAYVKINIMEID